MTKRKHQWTLFCLKMDRTYWRLEVGDDTPKKYIYQCTLKNGKKRTKPVGYGGYYSFNGLMKLKGETETGRNLEV